MRALVLPARLELALLDPQVARELGIVATKKLSARYRPGSRHWVKRRNPSYWRGDSELNAMQKSVERRARRYAVQ